MKTVVISGASSGIGQAMVEKFSQQDWSVLMVARNKERLEKIQSENKNCSFIVCDLTDKVQIQNLAQEVKQKNIKINALINNAGIYQPESIDQDSDSVWEQHFESNLMSAVRFNRVFWESLKETQGSILNISSTLGIRPIPNSAAYSALKSAMNNWTLSLALEGAPHGINANAICPGIIDTPIHGFFDSEEPEDLKVYSEVQKAQPLGRTGKPKDIANMALQLCSESSNWTTGALINIDGGILLNS